MSRTPSDGYLVPGWYLAKVLGFSVAENESLRFEYVVTKPEECAGHRLFDRLASPEEARHHKDRGELAEKRMRVMAKRFGVSEKIPDLTGTLVILRIVSVWVRPPNPERRRKIPDPAGTTQLDPLGVFRQDDPTIPPDIRVELGLSLLPGQMVDEKPSRLAKGLTKKPLVSFVEAADNLRKQLVEMLHHMPYQFYLETKHWKKKREEALDAARHTCQLCNTKGDDVVLHVHHKSYARRGAEWLCDLVVLCQACHMKHHEAGSNAL